MKKLLGLFTLVALASGPIVQAVSLQQNAVFPDTAVIISQEVGVQPVGVRDISTPADDIDAKSGQTFTLDSETTLRAITIKTALPNSWGTQTNDFFQLWIGENTGTPTTFVAGATNLLVSINLSNVTVVANNYYTFNLDSDLVLPAGNYAFQFAWEDSSWGSGNHQWFMTRSAGGSTYTNGTATNVQTQDGSSIPFPVDGGNIGTDSLVFGLHSAVVGLIPTLAVNPTAAFIVADPATGGSTAVEVSFTSDTSVDINPVLSDESNPGSFSSWAFYPQTLFSSPATLTWFFDNSVNNLPVGSTATGLVTIAWNETGSTTTNEVLVPISAFVGFPAGEVNTFTGNVSSNWGASTNWSLNRVPGAAGSDVGVIESADTVEVAANYTGNLPWDTLIRGGATLNIGSDFLGAARLLVGSESGQHGFVNQTAGTVGVTNLTIGESSATAPANSVYTLSGGTLALAANGAAPTINIYSNGQLDIVGGTFSIDQGPADTVVNGPGFVKLQSGTFTSLGTVASDVLNFNTGLEITGGSVDLNGQNKFWNLKVIGNNASIHIEKLNDPAGATVGQIDFVMGATGISPITSVAWMHLRDYIVTVDGSNYTGGSGTFLLFDCSNLATITTSTIATNDIIVTNFPEGLIVTVEQNQEVDEVILTIVDPNAKGYDAWIAGYGLAGANAAWDFDYDGDTEINFYEYGFGGNPTNAAVKGYVPTAATVEAGGTNYLDYVYPRRIGTQAETELIYQPLFSTNLLGTNWSGNGVLELAPAGILDANYESVTNRVNIGGEDEGFMKLSVESTVPL